MLTVIPASVDMAIRRSYSADRGTKLLVLAQLRESPVADVISDTLYDDLEAVLGEYASPTPAERVDLVLRLSRALEQVADIVPYRVRPLPEGAAEKG